MTTYDTTPLEVLSDLLKTRSNSLQSITLSELTAAYLAWLREARVDHLPLNAEFAYVAATLIQWKSRDLVRDPEEEPLEVTELFEKLRLEDTRRGVDALRTRLEKPSHWRHVTSGDIPSTGDERTTEDNSTTVVEQATVAELIDTLQQALTNTTTEPLRIEQEPIPIEQMLGWLRQRLHSELRLDLQQLLDDRPTEQPALFLTALELARTGEVEIKQSEPFAPCILTALP